MSQHASTQVKIAIRDQNSGAVPQRSYTTAAVVTAPAKNVLLRGTIGTTQESLGNVPMFGGYLAAMLWNHSKTETIELSAYVGAAAKINVPPKSFCLIRTVSGSATTYFAKIKALANSAPYTLAGVGIVVPEPSGATWIQKTT